MPKKTVAVRFFATASDLFNSLSFTAIGVGALILVAHRARKKKSPVLQTVGATAGYSMLAAYDHNLRNIKLRILSATPREDPNDLLSV
jgi:hypothetical protein